MWAARLFSIAYRQPLVKRVLWRSWYNFVSDRYRDRSWTFMNYGFRPQAGDPILALDPRDEADRYCIQLYHRVAGAVDLAGLDVLEVGSGRGGGAAFVAQYLRPRQLVGVDISWRAVRFSRRNHARPGLTFQVGDAENLKFADETFDAVINIESSHCYGNPDAFFSEVRRVLRPGGHFLYADFRVQEELPAWRAHLRATGLELVSEQDITAAVVAALEQDDARKRDLIDRKVDLPLRRVFRKFSALRGTQLYEEFRSGSLRYVTFDLRKPQGSVTPSA